MMEIIDAFHGLIALHILFGAPGLLLFWVPVFAKKGGHKHVFWGRCFVIAMIVAASAALIMSIMTLLHPMATHPHLTQHADFSDPSLVRGIFGWMMLYLAILTLNLTLYGWATIQNRRNHMANRGWWIVALQGLLTAASLNCFVQGVLIWQPMMMGIAFVGFATVGTNLAFMYKRHPGPMDWLLEHIKGIVGTGISVYTAFFAFGAVRYIPELALAPALWAVPLSVGLALIIYHQQKIKRGLKPSKPAVMGKTQLPT